MKTLSIIKKKLCSMRYSKKEVQKETSRDAKQFIYGYTECINDLLEYINAGGDGLPEHELFAEQSQSKKPEKLPVCKYCGLKESTAMEMIKEVFEPIQLGENEVVNQSLEFASKKAWKPEPADQPEWTTNKVIDFVNWYLRLCFVRERFQLENQDIIESFLKGDDYKVWWRKIRDQPEQPKNIEQTSDDYYNRDKLFEKKK